MVPIEEPISATRFYDKEFNELSYLVKDRQPFIAIVGSRGSGKTSLVRTLLENHPGIFVSLEQYENKKNMRRSYFIDQVYEELDKVGQKYPYLFNELSIRKESYSNSFTEKSFTKLEITELFERLNETASKHKSQFLLAIDDAELLSRFQHLNFEDLFAFIIDNCRHISIILLADDENTIRKACNLDDPKAPLFGRVYHMIKLHNISPETITNFVRNYLMEHSHFHPTVNQERYFSNLVAHLSNTFNTILLLAKELGNLKTIDSQAVNALLEKYSKIQHKKFEDFLSSRPAKDKYEKIIQFLARQDSSWKMIKESLELDLGEKLYDKNFTELLTHLEKNGYIENDSGLYRLKDPLLRYFYNKKGTTDSYLSSP